MAPKVRQAGAKAESGTPAFNAKEIRANVGADETTGRLIVELFEALTGCGLEALTAPTTPRPFGFNVECLGENGSVVVKEILNLLGLLCLLADGFGRVRLV
ncbi:hypothetical protein C475_11725 [Halosimplex carlsbadense 2-9-1]|uniref:Uncharacterized protein n=1 Tax=Halosimplex carlsbadense 2-9-1 TaxID=797114 RepID=M0CSQ7_9EURY|nr:hypothetical protein C475_11725 [Halosimplex carlsbadense 2-9-1]